MTEKELAKYHKTVIKTAKGIKAVRKEIDEELERHKQAIEVLQHKIIMIQKGCRHFSKTFYSDPSGNNDSFYECDDCGKDCGKTP